MKMKRFSLLLTALLLSMLIFPNSELNSKSDKDYVKVIYFHGDFRCTTCNRLEKFTKETVRETFKKELKNQLVKLEIINFDKDENKHFTDDYNLFNQALIVVKYKNGKQKEWKNLEKIWEYSGDQSKFSDYVEKEIKKYL